MEQSEREGSNWDHIESEDAYRSGGLPAGAEDLPPSLEYTPTPPRAHPVEWEPAARVLKALPVDRDPLRILASGLAGDANGTGDVELAEIVRLSRAVEER